MSSYSAFHSTPISQLLSSSVLISIYLTSPLFVAPNFAIHFHSFSTFSFNLLISLSEGCSAFPRTPRAARNDGTIEFALGHSHQ